MLQSTAAFAILLWVVVIACYSLGAAAQASGMGMAPINRRESVRNAKAREVLRHMNLSADPCRDFFDFACGNWARSYAAPHPDEVVTVQSQLQMRVNKDLQTLLDEPPSTHDGLSSRKVKDFYKSCLTVESSSARQHAFLIDFMKRHGGLPSVPGTQWQLNYNWLHIIALLRSNYGLDILVGLDIDTNLSTMRGNSVYLSEPKSTLIPAELCSAMVTHQADLRDEPYERIQRRVLQNMQTWFSLREAEASRFAGDVVRFEFELCKQMRKESTLMRAPEEPEVGGPAAQRGTIYRTGQRRLHGNRQNAYYPSHSLQQLSQQFGGVIDFKHFVNTALETSINDQVYMRSETYFQHLAHVIRGNTKPTLANYIMYRALSELNFPSDDRPSRRTKYCVELVLRYFPKIIGEMYSRKYHRSEVRSDIELLYNEISKAIDESFNADWMEENARRAARQKLAQFKLRFPIYQNLDLSDLRIEREDYWDKLERIMKYNSKQELSRLYSVELSSGLDSVEAPDVRVKLESMESEIVIGWGLLQPPFYQYFYPNSLKYSLVGQQLAHELTTAFDEQAWNQNPTSPAHWDEYTAEGFRNRSLCFRTQYSNYLHNNPEVFRNASKLRDIIADSSGLNIAFNAYLSWLDTVHPSNRVTLSNETLPEVNFTNTQLFFINFAQTRCAARHEEQPPPDFLPLDRHTTERYDVNGPLGNNAEFAREFGCSMGTEMNPDDKCVVY